MKIRSSTQIVEGLFPEATQGRLKVKNASAEVRRVMKRLMVMLTPHFESAQRMGVILGADDLRAVIQALIAEADQLSPDPHLQCPEELRHYLRRTMFDELVGEPSNVLYTTKINDEVVRYEAMPPDFWKSCLLALREDLGRGENAGNMASSRNHR